MTTIGRVGAAWCSRRGMPLRTRHSWSLALVLMGAWAGCTGLNDISIGTDARDGGFDVPLAPIDSGTPRMTVDTGMLPPATDVGMPGPPMCMTTAECAMGCPPGSRGCVCASTMMGLRCVPTCMISLECPPGPSGAALVCRMGLCTP